MLSTIRTTLARRPELLVLLGFALAAAALLVLGHIGAEVMAGDTRAFDAGVLVALRAATAGDGGWQNLLRGAALDITALGDNVTLALVVVAVAGHLALARHGRLALVLLVAAASGEATASLLKLAFARPRPDVVAHLTHFGTASFPSGHAMNAAVVYLTLAGIVSRTVARRALRAWALGWAVLLVLLIGASRLYLGVHWPTDVLAGWIAGAGWAVLWWSVARWVASPGQVSALGGVSALRKGTGGPR